MIVLYTDYGLNGPYLGQVKHILHYEAPKVPVLDLFANAPTYNPKAAAYLFSAYNVEFPLGTVFFAVVDPGVGGKRKPGILEADGRWYVGPDNGLFELIIRRAYRKPRWWDIVWQPDHLSATFHGRDLFAPIAARLACGNTPDKDAIRGADFREKPNDDLRRPEWPDDLAEIIYIDDFGNALTGLRFKMLPDHADVSINSLTITRGEKFLDVSKGSLIYYENSNGLLEIAVNQGRAEELLEIALGVKVSFEIKN
jgi:S-adenosylmethionine hydrolase